MSPLRVLLMFGLLGAVAVIRTDSLRADELKTLPGKTVAGTLTQIDEKNITLTTDAGPVETPISQALLLTLRKARALPADAKYFAVRLLDDSTILAKTIAYSNKAVELTLISGATVKVPLTAIVSVLKDAQDGAISRQFRTLAARGKLRSDRILLVKDGELNPIDGTLGEIDPDGKAISFKREGSEPIKARFELLHGIVFLRTEVPAESAICKVTDQDGNTLNASKLAYDGTTLNLTIPTGAQLAVKGDAIAKLDFNLGRLSYLSDLEPAKLKESLFFGGFPTMRKDANQDGRPIVLLDKSFPKGLTLEGGTVLEYNLAGKFKDFKAIIGVDTRYAEDVLGKTTVTVYGDGTKLLREVALPTQLRPIAVNVQDVGTLRIVVEGPNFTGLSAYVTLADARVSQ